MAKHSEKKGKRKIIQLKDHMPQQPAEPSSPEEETVPQEEELPQATIEYGEGEDGAEKEKKPLQTPKAVYRVAVVLLVAVLALALWVNRDNLTPEKIWNWVQIQVMGDGTGDGYPVSITGSSVAEQALRGRSSSPGATALTSRFWSLHPASTCCSTRTAPAIWWRTALGQSWMAPLPRTFWRGPLPPMAGSPWPPRGRREPRR